MTRSITSTSDDNTSGGYRRLLMATGGSRRLIIVAIVAGVAVLVAAAATTKVGASGSEWSVTPTVAHSLRQQEQLQAVSCLEESGIDIRTPSAEDDEWISNVGLQSIAGQEALLGGRADPWVWIQTEEGSRKI